MKSPVLLIGSRYFFSVYADFSSKDRDELRIVDTNEFAQMRQIMGQGRCYFEMKRHSSAQEYIDWAVQAELGMVIGKFLVPEFVELIGMTIEDLPKLEPLIGRLDSKHEYEAIIFYSYLQNKDFYLTDEQRLAAYKSYKESRGML